MSDHTDNGKPNLHVVRGKAVHGSSSPFGTTTQQFFDEGERQEATGWQDGEPPRREKGGDFDKIPRQKGGTVVLAVFGACLALGVVLAFKAVVGVGHKAQQSSAASQSSPAQAAPQTRDAGSDQSGPTPEPTPAAAKPPGIRI
jgi:hypothetical protein